MSKKFHISRKRNVDSALNRFNEPIFKMDSPGKGSAKLRFGFRIGSVK